jgi:hypothetical protein
MDRPTLTCAISEMHIPLQHHLTVVPLRLVRRYTFRLEFGRIVTEAEEPLKPAFLPCRSDP